MTPIPITRRLYLVAWSLGLIGCSKLTKVEAPDVLQPQQLATPSGAAVLRAGAINYLYYFVSLNAYGVPGDDALLSDQLVTGNDPSAAPIDERTATPNNGDLPYIQMQIYRGALLTAIAAYKSFPSLSQAYTGNMYSLLGYLEVYFGELFCSGVPLSTVVDNTVHYGTPLTTQQIFQQAAAHFDSAVTLSADTARFLSLAQVGLGRTLLDIGQFAQAAAAVHTVPTNFVFNAEATGSVAQSNIIGLNQASGLLYGVADRQGVNGLDYISSGDPRIPVSLVGTASDGVTPIYEYLPYSTTSSPVPIATGVEARLIEAEASLQAGDNVGWLAALNALRADSADTHVAGLGPLPDPGTPSARVDLMFRERAFWMFFTGHRVGDLRRLIRQYGRGAETVFPTGPYKNLGNFGTAVNLPVGNTENPNPNFHGCLDRNA